MKILNSKEIKEIEKDLNEIHNSKFKMTDFAVLSTSKENKIWLASKDIFKLKLDELRINSMGVYFGRIDKGKLRMSVEGAQFIAKTAKKNICEIDDFWNFMRGFDVKPTKEINCDENEYVIVKYKDNCSS